MRTKEKNSAARSDVADNDDGSAGFKLQTANAWLSESKLRPIPKKLFGEYWLEGELAIMFADTGKGKSIMAVQIAEAIARGEDVGPIAVESAAQSVLLIDCELSAKQFEMRYSAEPEPGDEFLTGHYEFSDNFHRAQIDPGIHADFEDQLRSSIGTIAEQAGARIVIIDNLSFLKSSHDTAGSALDLMRELKRLKDELGLSILVLAHTPKRVLGKPLTVNDLAGFKALSNFADNIFAIGQSRIASDIRYIKHVKLRSTEMLCDEHNVPAFRISKRGGNFLSFEFLRYTAEAVHLADHGDALTYSRVSIAKKFAAEGMSQRTIAAEMGVSLGSVNKYLHMQYLEPRHVANCGDLDIALRADRFPGSLEVDAEIMHNLGRIAETDDRLDRFSLELNVQELEEKRLAEQRKYWIATGKIANPQPVAA